MNAPRQFVFGYGSLVAAHRHGDVATLRGHRRVWGVAMDNRRDLPGYKSYRLRADGSRPQVYVAFLDIEPDPACAVTGVCVAVDGDELLALDERERNYDRVDVSAAVEGCPPGRVFAFVGTAAGRARLREGLAQGSAVISRAYLDGVLDAVAVIARDELAAVARLHRLAGLAELDLERVEIPATTPAPLSPPAPTRPLRRRPARS